MLMLFTEQHLRSPKSQRPTLKNLPSSFTLSLLRINITYRHSYPRSIRELCRHATAKLATSLRAFQTFMHISITYRPSYPHTDAGTRSSVVERPNRKVVDSSPIRSHRGFFFLRQSLCHSPNDILLHLNHAA